nr:YccF domain-containing protein [Blautia sp. CAG:237]
MAFENLIVGCLWCITIIGIPFGKQFFKMERLSFMPFGANVIG